MTDIYKRVEPKEGEYVQFVGVHVLAWRQSWGKPTDAFIEDEETENNLAQKEARIRELEELLGKVLEQEPKGWDKEQEGYFCIYCGNGWHLSCSKNCVSVLIRKALSEKSDKEDGGE